MTVKHLSKFKKYIFTMLIGGFVMIANTGYSEENDSKIQIEVVVDNNIINANLIDNATTRALIAKFPITLPMMDLYSREMCYRFNNPLPANEVKTQGYTVGDIVYWTPMHSFVIMYKQNGEVISNLQKIGNINTGVNIFEKTGDTYVTFRLHQK